MGRDEWEDQRSSYGRVLESLDAIVRRHPSAGAVGEPEPAEPASSLPENVVDLRTRLTPVRSGGYPDDAA